MFVICDSLFDEISVEPKLVLHPLCQLLINGELFRMKRKVVILGLVKLVKWVPPKTFDVDAVCRVSHENLSDNVPSIS